MVSRSPETTEHAVAVLGTSGGEGREDVVGLEVLLADRGDVHRLERLFEQRHLTDELGRGLAPGALVLGVLARAEREPRDVEGDGDVRRLVLLQQDEQHRQEPVDRVRVLPVAGDETVDRKRVERAERERMAVDEQEGRLFRVRHGLSLVAAPDTRSERRRAPNARHPSARSRPRTGRPPGRQRRRRTAPQDGHRVPRALGRLLGRPHAGRGKSPGRRHPARRRARRARRVARLDLVGHSRRPRAGRDGHRDQCQPQPVGHGGLGDRHLHARSCSVARSRPTRSS